MDRVRFMVEEAGCESCGKLIGSALSKVASVETIDIDEAADIATVVLSGAVSRDVVDSALAEASTGAGHEYRVRTDSWQPLS